MRAEAVMEAVSDEGNLEQISRHSEIRHRREIALGLVKSARKMWRVCRVGPTGLSHGVVLCAAYSLPARTHREPLPMNRMVC